MKRKNIFFTAIVALTLGAAIILTGCGSRAASDEGGAKNQIDNVELQDGKTAIGNTGVIILSVNPEISIEYDEYGKVVALSGNNHDGEEIVSVYKDYIGKDCKSVLKDLIVEIYEEGYFVKDIDGNKKNIVIQIEPGSVLPEDDFLENIYSNTQETIKELNLTSGIVTIDENDYDPTYSTEDHLSHYITLEKAQEIALTQANVNAADAVFNDKEFDFDDGTAVFELEFTVNGIEYDYDIDAVTGKVLKAEHKAIRTDSNTGNPSDKDDAANGDNTNNTGVTDYNGTDYGPNNDGVTDYDDTDYGPNNDGVTDYNDTDYGPNNDGVTDYDDTDYGPNNDGVTDYNDTDYGPNNDGVTDYDDTDYGPNNDGVTDYDDTDYGSNNDRVTDYHGGDSHYDNGGSDYGDSDYDD